MATCSPLSITSSVITSQQRWAWGSVNTIAFRYVGNKRKAMVTELEGPGTFDGRVSNLLKRNADEDEHIRFAIEGMDG